MLAQWQWYFTSRGKGNVGTCPWREAMQKQDVNDSSCLKQSLITTKMSKKSEVNKRHLRHISVKENIYNQLPSTFKNSISVRCKCKFAIQITWNKKNVFWLLSFLIVVNRKCSVGMSFIISIHIYHTKYIRYEN